VARVKRFAYQPGEATAYESIRFLTIKVPFGWLIRSVHSWSAHLMIISSFFGAVYVGPFFRNDGATVGLALIFAPAKTAPTQALANAVHFLQQPCAVGSLYCTGVWPADKADEICGCSLRDETCAAPKLLQRSSGIAAISISASWLTMNPTSQGKAFCMKP